jgi:predicted secreted protein
MNGGDSVMKRALLTVLTVIIAVMLLGCGSENDGLVTADSASFERVVPDTILVQAGEEFEISLYNPHWDAGYCWIFEHEFNSLFVELIEYRLEIENPDLLGSPVYEIWTFRAEKRGSTSALLECVRPWIADDTPRDVRMIFVCVQPGW